MLKRLKRCCPLPNLTEIVGYYSFIQLQIVVLFSNSKLILNVYGFAQCSAKTIIVNFPNLSFEKSSFFILKLGLTIFKLMGLIVSSNFIVRQDQNIYRHGRLATPNQIKIVVNGTLVYEITERRVPIIRQISFFRMKR